MSSLNISGLTFLLNKRPSNPGQPNRYFQATVIQCNYTWALTVRTCKKNNIIKGDTDHSENLSYS